MVKCTEDKDRFGILENDKEENMAKIKDMTFGEALEAMKRGEHIRQSDWDNGVWARLCEDKKRFEIYHCAKFSSYNFTTEEMCANDWEIAKKHVENPQFEVWYEIHKSEFSIHSKKDLKWAFNAGIVEAIEAFEKSKIEWLDDLIERLGTVDPNYVVFSRGWQSALSNLRRMANGGGYLVNYAVDRSGIGGEVPPEHEVRNLEWAKRMLKEGKRVGQVGWSNRDAYVFKVSSGRYYLFSHKDDTHPVPYDIEQLIGDSTWEIVE